MFSVQMVRGLWSFALPLLAVTAIAILIPNLETHRSLLLVILMTMAITFSALHCGRVPATLALILAMFELALIFPGDWLAVNDPDEALAMAAMLITGLALASYVGRTDAMARAQTLAIEQAQADSRRTHQLLRELSHRLSNDLMMLVSSMELRRLSIGKTESVEQVLDSLGGQIIALSRVYQRLQSSDFQTDLIDIGPFLTSLCEDLRSTRFALQPVTLRIEIDEVQLAFGRAVILGLMVNELLTNIYKHAFPDDRAGTVRITLRRERDAPGMALLMVSDDGAGFGGLKREGSQGQNLLYALAAELGGTFVVERADGWTIAHMRLAIENSSI